MRHKTAARKGEDGGWHYVSMSRHGGHPLGYCRDHEPHATEAEARKCYGQFVRDSIQLNAEQYVHWTDCAICGAPTKSGAKYGDDGYGGVSLCLMHMSKESVVLAAQLDGPAGDAWLS